MDIKTYLNEKREIVEAALQRFMLEESAEVDALSGQHIEAMRYSLFVGGKRLRPILCLAAAEAIDPSDSGREKMLPVACALECIHTYSLIHDDLPAMDDDDLRRGKPTNHKLFGEAGAILAGDGLLTFAFDLLSDRSNSGLTDSQRLTIIQLIARASGSLGMVGGQAMDIAHENRDFPITTLQEIHRKKTGALITCSLQAGCVGASGDMEQFEALTLFGAKIGLAFQIVDDLLNATATTEQLGKAAGSDEERGKATYPSYFGVDRTRKLAQDTIEEALAALSGFGESGEPLRALARYIYTRSH